MLNPSSALATYQFQRLVGLSAAYPTSFYAGPTSHLGQKRVAMFDRLAWLKR